MLSNRKDKEKGWEKGRRVALMLQSDSMEMEDLSTRDAKLLLWRWKMEGESSINSLARRKLIGASLGLLRNDESVHGSILATSARDLW